MTRSEPDDLIERLDMAPHPEGGHFVETWRAETGSGRANATAIHFLLRAGESSHWHRVDADELWIHNAGDGVVLSVAGAAGEVVEHDIGDRAGAVFQALVPAGRWQAARPRGDWALVTCVVSPGFEFSGFELAPPGWEPDSPK